MATARSLLLIVAASVATPSHGRAQDIPFSAEATETCLAAANDPDARRHCIGDSAAACIDTPDGYTTAGMAFCFDREAQFWDARLNAAYAALMAIEEHSDAEMAEIGASAPSTAEALRAMQRAWIPYRDAACDYERSQWGGGTGGGPASIACMMSMTGEQALELENRLKIKQQQ